MLPRMPGRPPRRRRERPEDLHDDPRGYYSPDRARDYATSKSMRRQQLRLVVRLLQLVEKFEPSWTWERAVLLDAGCGPGFYHQELAELGATVVGVDVVPHFLELAKKGFRGDRRGRSLAAGLVCADLRALPFRDGSFDAYFSTSALQWALKQDVVATASEVGRVVPRGALVCAQLYVDSSDPHELEEIGGTLKRLGGLEGGWVVEGAGTRKVKVFLVAKRRKAGGGDDG
ncbi:MAG: hypothetical protein Kow0069_26910 [Promethearchaeota archaeon]